MTPDQAAEAIRAIARYVDATPQPSANFVSSKLRRVLAAIGKPFSSSPGDYQEDRQEKRDQEKRDRERDRAMDKAKKDLGNQVEKLVDESFKDIERQTR